MIRTIELSKEPQYQKTLLHLAPTCLSSFVASPFLSNLPGLPHSARLHTVSNPSLGPGKSFLDSTSSPLQGQVPQQPVLAAAAPSPPSVLTPVHVCTQSLAHSELSRLNECNQVVTVGTTRTPRGGTLPQHSLKTRMGEGRRAALLAVMNRA